MSYRDPVEPLIGDAVGGWLINVTVTLVIELTTADKPCSEAAEIRASRKTDFDPNAEVVTDTSFSFKTIKKFVPAGAIATS